MSGYLYILELEDNCYYVGISNDISNRLQQHFDNQGCLWTIIHKPIDIYLVSKIESDFDELNITLDMMRTYGINRVRGACFSETRLLSYKYKIAEMLLRTINNSCYTCGGRHMSSQCPTS